MNLAQTTFRFTPVRYRAPHFVTDSNFQLGLGSTTLSITTFSITLNNDTQHNGACAVMLSVIYPECHKSAPYAECHYAECHGACSNVCVGENEAGLLNIQVTL